MQPLKISLIVEKRVDQKAKVVRWEIFHIITAKDALGKEFYPAQSVGTISVKQLQAEIEEHQYQMDYRNQVLKEIEHLEKIKAKHSNREKAVEEYIKNYKS